MGMTTTLLWVIERAFKRVSNVCFPLFLSKISMRTTAL